MYVGINDHRERHPETEGGKWSETWRPGVAETGKLMGFETVPVQFQ